MTESQIPSPNLAGYPTKTNIEFVRHWIERQNLDVSQLDSIRLCQWLRQLLKYIDNQEEKIQHLHNEIRVNQELDTWNDDGGQ